MKDFSEYSVQFVIVWGLKGYLINRELNWLYAYEV